MNLWVNIGSGNGLLIDGTKPLPESVLTYHQKCSVAWERFRKRYSWNFQSITRVSSQSDICFWKIFQTDSLNVLRYQLIKLIDTFSRLHNILSSRFTRMGSPWPTSCSSPRHSYLTRHSLMLANGRIRQSLTALVEITATSHRGWWVNSAWQKVQLSPVANMVYRRMENVE